MSEPVSALNEVAFDGLCQVRESGLQGMITLRGDLSDPAIAEVVSQIAGVDMPGQRGVFIGETRGLLWMSPDEALMLCPYAEAAQLVSDLTERLGTAHALAVDVSDARAVFTLRGPHLREVIAKLAPVDMSPAAFTPDMVRRTRFAQVAAAFWLVDDETARIVCFRSVAPYMFALLCNAATPGTAVGMF